MDMFIGPDQEHDSLISYVQKNVPALQSKAKQQHEDLVAAQYQLKLQQAKVKAALEKDIPNEFRNLKYSMENGAGDLGKFKEKMDTDLENIASNLKKEGHDRAM